MFSPQLKVITCSRIHCRDWSISQAVLAVVGHAGFFGELVGKHMSNCEARQCGLGVAVVGAAKILEKLRMLFGHWTDDHLMVSCVSSRTNETCSILVMIYFAS